MRQFQNISIKRKLMLVILLTGGIALLLTSAALFEYEMTRFQQNLKDSLITQAEIIGDNSTAALTFRDQKAAEEILSALKAAHNITNAVIYSEDGSVFARYRRNDINRDYIPDLNEKDAYHFKIDHVDITRRIILDGREIGLLYIRSDLNDFYSRLKWYAGTILILTVLSLFLSLMLSSRLQHTITKPILDLLNVMKTISQEKNYSLRASVQGHDEVGSLTEGFNEMLSQLQERDRELDLHRKHLEELVLKRTNELRNTNKQLQQELTIRKQAEAFLKESEERYRSLIENISLGVTLVDKDYKIIMTNEAQGRLFGKPVQAFTGKHCFQEFEKRGTVCSHCPGTVAMATGRASETDSRGVRDDGTAFNVRIKAFPLFNEDKTIKGFIELVEDITEKQQTEEKIRQYYNRLSELASQLALAEETVRRRFSEELHDFMGQELALLKLKLSELIESVSDDDIKSKLTELYQVIDKSIEFARSIVFELSPPILYELGFEASAEWLGKQILKNYDITFHFEDDSKPKPLTNDVKVILYTSLREVIVNIVKHAKARNVTMSLCREENTIKVMVTDDGIGFNASDTDYLIMKAASFGLFSIEDRLKRIGGRLEITSQPGQGTTVTMVAPLNV